MHLSSIAVIGSLIFVLICVAWVIYTKVNQKQFTKERYVLSTMTASSAIALAAISALSSKKGVVDHVTDTAASIFGISMPIETSAPLSEKLLIFVLANVSVYLIMNSLKNWTGLISTDEAASARLRRPRSIREQALDEAKRLIHRLPPREIATRGPQRGIRAIDPPRSSELIWHEHAKELFQLWYATCDFSSQGETAWDSKIRCWLGRDTRRDSPLYLFCFRESPTKADVDAAIAYVRSTTKEPAQLAFVVHQGDAALPTTADTSPKLQILTEVFLLNSIVDFSDYFADINNRVMKTKFRDTGVTISDIYTPSAAVTLDGSVVYENLEEHLPGWASQPDGEHLAVLGEYGQGKSTAALLFAFSAIRSNFQKTGGRIPILFELRGMSPINLSPDQLLGTWAQRYKIHAAAMMKLLIAGRIILIFEGFDEMANVASVEARLSHFRALWKFAYPRSKILFTGRRNLFFADEELEIVFKRAEGETAAICKILELLPFDLPKITDSLRWKDAATTGEILRAAERHPQILDIVSRPSLLYIVAALWGELRTLTATGQMTSAKVIDRFVLHSYQRQEAKADDGSEFMELATTERRFFHEGLGHELIKGIPLGIEM